MGRRVRSARPRTPGLLALGGLFSRQAREGRKVAHQSWVVDASAFEVASGPVPVTDHHTAVAETIAWLQRRETSPVHAP